MNRIQISPYKQYKFIHFFTVVSPGLNPSHRKQNKHQDTAIDKWVCTPPTKFIYWNLVPQRKHIWRWSPGEENGALMNGIHILIKETSESCLTPSTMRGPNEKTAIYEPRSRFSSDTEYVSALILGFPASGRVTNKFLLFIRNPSNGNFVIAARTN